MIGGLTDKVKEFLENEKPEKAALMIFREEGGEPEKLEAQFNPSEYTITRSVKMQDASAASKEPTPEGAQVTEVPKSILTVTLYFDSYTDLGTFSIRDTAKQIKSASGVMGAANVVQSLVGNITPNMHAEVNNRCMDIAMALKFVPDLHAPPLVCFTWGNMEFVGHVISSTINFTMFNPQGMPVRMKVALEIKGEEADRMASQQAMPNQSPDRTKERFLPEGDQLWMLASNEYKDPAKWKVIAKANGILNPRAINKGVRLKVPSIQ